MNFYTGQKVVCITSTGSWYTDNYSHQVPGPVKDEICLIEGFIPDGGLYLRGYPQDDGYAPYAFAPIIESNSTADIANQIFEQHPELREIKTPELV